MNEHEVKTIRKRLGLSQREFAKRLGIKRQTVACWESGIRTPSKKMIAEVEKLSTKSVDSEIVDRKSVDTNQFVDRKSVDTNQFVDRKSVDRESVDKECENVDSDWADSQSVDKSVDKSVDTRVVDSKVVDMVKNVDMENVTGEGDTSKGDKSNVTLLKVTDSEKVTDVTSEKGLAQTYYETMYKDAASPKAKGVISLCTITQPKDSEKESSLRVRGFYDISRIPDLIAEANKLNGRFHIYTGIHPLRERPDKGRGKEKDILGVAFFAADVDAKDFIDDPTERQKAIKEKAFYQWTDELLVECKAKALAQIHEVCDKVSVPPSAIIDSGHGFYPIFKFDKFIEFSSDQHREELKQVNKAFHEAFAADSTFDFARILRVPGTRNIKPGYPADCKLIEFHPDRRYTLDDIRKFEKLTSETSPKPESEKEKQTKPQTVSLNDQELIEKAKNAKNGEKFTVLWEGDTTGYDSQSEADLALCCLLAFWTGGDYDRIDKLFRQSGLYREKWHREDYREATINQAIENTVEFYNPNKIGVINNQSVIVANARLETTFTEGWLARKFVELHGDDVRYCYVWDKWLMWTGRRWKIDHTGEVNRKAKDVIKRLLKEASETDDDKTRKLLASYAHKSDTRSKYSAIIELSKCEVPILPEDLDTDPMLFNCTNGTIDLRTGELRKHKREDYITKLALVEFDPNAQAPRWEKFLNEIFSSNQGIIEFLQRAVGYALTGEIREQILLILYGTGANGKTTFLETLLNIFGDYGKPAEQDLLIVKRHEQHPTGVADLMGARFVSAMEIGEGKRLNEALVKRLTGKDRLKARFMRQDFFEFEPTHKIFMAVNHKPHIRGTDTGIWRRIRLIPFAVEIPEHKQDKQLQERLVKEASGILAWAVRGCLAWQEQGLGITTEIEKATNEYRVEMDTIGAFITECCIEGDNYKAKASELYECYCNWCDKSREQAIPQKNFAFYLTERGFERRRLKNGYHWFGVGILDTKDEPSDDEDERLFTHDKHSEDVGLSDSDIQKVNPGEPKSILYEEAIDCSRECGTGFIRVHPNGDETNSDKGLDRVNDHSPSEASDEHKGGLSEKLDEYLTKCPDSWVRMIQDSVKQNRFTSLGIAIEASRRMSNGDSQGAWRMIRQNGGTL